MIIKRHTNKILTKPKILNSNSKVSQTSQHMHIQILFTFCMGFNARNFIKQTWTTVSSKYVCIKWKHPTTKKSLFIFHFLSNPFGRKLSPVRYHKRAQPLVQFLKQNWDYHAWVFYDDKHNIYPKQPLCNKDCKVIFIKKLLASLKHIFKT